MGLFSYGKNSESGSRMTEVSEIPRLSPEKYRVLDKLVGHLLHKVPFGSMPSYVVPKQTALLFYHQSLILEN